MLLGGKMFLSRPSPIAIPVILKGIRLLNGGGDYINGGYYINGGLNLNLFKYVYLYIYYYQKYNLIQYLSHT